jgi:orotate phosphoribosyltransferase
MENWRDRRIKAIFEETGAIVRNTHVVLASGLHSDTYIKKRSIFAQTSKVSELCKFIADYCRYGGIEIDSVIGPAVGGAILAQWTAHHLSEIQGKEVFALCADRYEKKGKAIFFIKGDQDVHITMKRILVVEDVVTTGDSVRQVVQVARDIAGMVVGVGALFNRGGLTYKQVGDVTMFGSLMNIKFDTYKERDCPLCKANVPINTTLGHGK